MPGGSQHGHGRGSGLGHRHHLHPAAERVSAQEAVVELICKNVLCWRLSNSLDTEICLNALEIALSAGGKPEIFHSDHGCQFTYAEFVARLRMEEIKISWSGRKRCFDNILVERLWRTVKYEEDYLRDYSDGGRLKLTCPASCGGIAM